MPFIIDDHIQAAFDCLGIKPTQDLQAVKAQFRKMALILHPDKTDQGSDGSIGTGKDDNGDRFKIMSAAYEIICKHIKGQDEVNMDDPDFQILYDLLHACRIYDQRGGSMNRQSGGYASGGSSCDGEDEEDDSYNDDTDDDEEDGEDVSSDANRIEELSDGNEIDELEQTDDTEDDDDTSEIEPVTPAQVHEQLKHVGHPHLHGHHCGGNAQGGHACHHVHHAVNPLAKPDLPSHKEHVELLLKHEHDSKLQGRNIGLAGRRPETDAERKTRVKLILVEQEIAKHRREEEAKKKKELARLAREQEQFEAAQRRAEKNAKKRAVQQKKAEQSKQDLATRLALAQENRSNVFDRLTACAKIMTDEEYFNEREAIRKDIVEKKVAPTGWKYLHVETVANTEQSSKVNATIKDALTESTTLLHLAVQASDAELVEWLCALGARPEERDGEGYTAFHRALVNGDKPMLDYFFASWPPLLNDGTEDPGHMKIYKPLKEDEPTTSLVMLATLSGDAEVIDYVLDQGSLEEVEQCYRYAQKKLRDPRLHRDLIDGWKAVQAMLEQKEGFSIPLEFRKTPHNRNIYAAKKRRAEPSSRAGKSLGKP